MHASSSMNRPLLALLFAVGLLAILGVAAALAGSSPLGLVMTLVIAGVYVLGAMEVRRFAQATQGLSQALQDMPPSLARLEEWLGRVPPRCKRRCASASPKSAASSRAWRSRLT
ncbi:hypothetical protein [Ideonella paludis]|uniref:hypothetical protein n=1 Tax=Ideonella paludis TaxID=1233411 RepID=UPI003627D576